MTTGWFLNLARLRKSLSLRVLFTSGILCWAALTLLLASQPVGSEGRFFAGVGASWVVQVFAAVALFLAARGEGGTERRPFLLFGVAVAARLVADVVWVLTRALGLGLAEVFQVAAHAVSYALLFGVLLWLMARIRQEEVSVAALDTLALMLTFGLLIFYFSPFSIDELPVPMALAVIARHRLHCPHGCRGCCGRYSSRGGWLPAQGGCGG